MTWYWHEKEQNKMCLFWSVWEVSSCPMWHNSSNPTVTSMLNVLSFQFKHGCGAVEVQTILLPHVSGLYWTGNKEKAVLQIEMQSKKDRKYRLVAQHLYMFDLQSIWLIRSCAIFIHTFSVFILISLCKFFSKKKKLSYLCRTFIMKRFITHHGKKMWSYIGFYVSC